MQVAIALFEGITALDAVGPYEVLQRLPELATLGAIPTSERVVEHPDARIITAAGVSSGIDMALRLSALLFDEDAARAMQLMIEYDPQPPFDSGHPDRATPEVMARVLEYSRTKK